MKNIVYKLLAVSENLDKLDLAKESQELLSVANSIIKSSAYHFDKNVHSFLSQYNLKDLNDAIEISKLLRDVAEYENNVEASKVDSTPADVEIAEKYLEEAKQLVNSKLTSVEEERILPLAKYLAQEDVHGAYVLSDGTQVKLNNSIISSGDNVKPAIITRTLGGDVPIYRDEKGDPIPSDKSKGTEFPIAQGPQKDKAIEAPIYREYAKDEVLEIKPTGTKISRIPGESIDLNKLFIRPEKDELDSLNNKVASLLESLQVKFEDLHEGMEKILSLPISKLSFKKKSKDSKVISEEDAKKTEEKNKIQSLYVETNKELSSIDTIISQLSKDISSLHKRLNERYSKISTKSVLETVVDPDTGKPIGEIRSDTLAIYHAQQMTNILNEAREAVKVLRIKNKIVKHYKSLESLNVSYEVIVDDIHKDNSTFARIDDVLSESKTFEAIVSSASDIITSALQLLKDKSNLDKQKNKILSQLESFAGEVSETDISNTADSAAGDVISLRNEALRSIADFSEFIDNTLLSIPEKVKEFVGKSNVAPEKKKAILDGIEGQISLAQRPSEHTDLVNFLMNKVIVNTKFVNSIINNRSDLSVPEKQRLLSDKEAALEFITDKNPKMASYLFSIKENPVKAVKTDLYQNFVNITNWAKKSMVDALVREKIMENPLFNNPTFGVNSNELARSNLNSAKKELRTKSPQLAQRFDEINREASQEVTEFLNSDVEFKKLKNAIEYQMYYDFEYNVNSNLERRFDTYSAEKKSVASKIWNIQKQSGDSTTEQVKTHKGPGEHEKEQRAKQKQFDPSKFTSSTEEQVKLQELFASYEKQWLEFYNLKNKFVNDPTNVFGLNGSVSDKRPQLSGEASEGEKAAFLKARDNAEMLSYSEMSEQNKKILFNENTDISGLVLSTITLPDSETESPEHAKIGVGFSQEQLNRDVLSKLYNVANGTLAVAGEGLEKLLSYAKDLDTNKIKSIFDDIFKRFSQSSGNKAKSLMRGAILNVSRANVQLPSKQRDYNLYPVKQNDQDALLSDLIKKVYEKHCSVPVSEGKALLLSQMPELKESMTKFFNQVNDFTKQFGKTTEARISNFLQTSKELNDEIEKQTIRILRGAAALKDSNSMKIFKGDTSELLSKVLGVMISSLNPNYNGSVYDIFEVTSKVNLTNEEKVQFAKLIQEIFAIYNNKAQSIGASLEVVSQRESIEIANNDDITRSLMKILNASTDQTSKFGDDIDTKIKTLLNPSVSPELNMERKQIVFKALANSVDGKVLPVDKNATDEAKKNQEVARDQSIVTILSNVRKTQLTQVVTDKLDFEEKEVVIDLSESATKQRLLNTVQKLYSAYGLPIEEDYQITNISKNDKLYKTLYNFVVNAKFKEKDINEYGIEIPTSSEKEIDAKQKFIRVLNKNLQQNKGIDPVKYQAMVQRTKSKIAELSGLSINEYFGRIFESLPEVTFVMEPDYSEESDPVKIAEMKAKYEEDKAKFLEARKARMDMSNKKIDLLNELVVLIQQFNIDKQNVINTLSTIKNSAIGSQDERLDKIRINESVSNAINIVFGQVDNLRLLNAFKSAFKKYVLRSISGKDGRKYLDILSNQFSSQAIDHDRDLKQRAEAGDSEAIRTLISRALKDPDMKFIEMLRDMLIDLADKSGAIISYSDETQKTNSIQKMLTFLKTKGILADIAAEKDASRKETITKLATDWIEKRISFFEEAAKKFFIKLKDKKPETYFEMAKFRKPEEMAAALTTALKKEVAKAASDDEKRKIIHQMVNKLDERSQEIYTTHRVALPKNDKELHSVTRVAMEDFISDNMHLLQNTDRYDGCSFSAILSDILGSDKLLPEKNKSAKYPITLDGKPIRRYKAPLLFSIFGERGKDLVIETREKTYRMPELQIKMNNLEASPEEIIEFISNNLSMAVGDDLAMNKLYQQVDKIPIEYFDRDAAKIFNLILELASGGQASKRMGRTLFLRGLQSEFLRKQIVDNIINGESGSDDRKAIINIMPKMVIKYVDPTQEEIELALSIEPNEDISKLLKSSTIKDAKFKEIVSLKTIYSNFIGRK